MLPQAACGRDAITTAWRAVVLTLALQREPRMLPARRAIAQYCLYFACFARTSASFTLSGFFPSCSSQISPR